MKIKLIFFSLLLFTSVSNAQEITILNTITKKIISYATILNIKEKRGFYTNEKGHFPLTILNSDSISISHIGYETLKLKVSEIKDSIFLKPNLEILDEIKIVAGESKEKTIGYIKKAKTLSWNINEKTELATLIKYKKKYKTAYIRKVYIPIGKMQLDYKNNKVLKSYPKFNSVFRLHIYSNSKGTPGIELLKKPLIIECNQNSEKIIEVDVSKEFIKLPGKGVFIAIEMIGELDNKRKLLNKKNRLILPSFKFTKRKKRNISSVTFTKTIYDNGKWKTTKNHNKLIKNFSEFNMAVSLTLGIYD